MSTHLYVCDNGGPMTLGVDGTPPAWATCPVCVTALECTSCQGAQLQGAAQPFKVASSIGYRCANGHLRTLSLPEGAQAPESAQCPDCDGMLLPGGALAHAQEVRP
jgi:hypothetical protein